MAGSELYRKETETVESTTVYPFGVVDSRGREVGARVTLLAVEVADAPVPATWRPCSSSLDLGTHPGSRVQQVRRPRSGGEWRWRSFGASNGRKTFGTAAAREKYVARYLRDAERRARKAAAK